MVHFPAFQCLQSGGWMPVLAILSSSAGSIHVIKARGLIGLTRYRGSPLLSIALACALFRGGAATMIFLVIAFSAAFAFAWRLGTMPSRWRIFWRMGGNPFAIIASRALAFFLPLAASIWLHFRLGSWIKASFICFI